VPGVLAVRCRPERKELLLEAAPEIYFDDDHYRGYPAVLVRLDGDRARPNWRPASRRLAPRRPKSLVRRRGRGG
jgi:hypothetical protein